MEVIHSGPTFRFGVIGFLLLFCGLLLGLFFSPLILILTVPGVSLLLSWKKIQFNSVTQQIEVADYTLVFPQIKNWPMRNMVDVFVDYTWENDNKSSFGNGQISYQLGEQNSTFSRSFELQFRDQSGNKLPITDYTDYRAARKAAERVALITGLPLVDEYFEIQSQAVQRRKASGRR
ncbi:MAG: hypothetical protein ACK5Z2_04830 [Bacteroidota bacterium]|jgi:hypothetical protein